jgi:hypothetical protein
VRDTAGNLGPAATVSVNVIAALPTIASITVTGLTNGFVRTTTPTVTGTLSAVLPTTPTPGASLRIFRGGTLAGTATVSGGTNFSFTDSARAEGSTVTYTARVENGSAYSATSSGVAVTIDTIAPAAPTLSGNVNSKPYQNLTNTDTDQAFTTSSPSNPIADPTPGIVAALGTSLSGGETVSIYRWIGAGAPSSTTLPNANWQSIAFVSSGSSVSVTETSPALNRPDIEGAPGVLAAQRYYFARRADPAGNFASSAIFTVNHGYLSCSAYRARNRTGQNHASYTTGSGTTATFSVPITTCAGCHTTNGGYVSAPGIGAYTDRYWCVR